MENSQPTPAVLKNTDEARLFLNNMPPATMVNPYPRISDCDTDGSSARAAVLKDEIAYAVRSWTDSDWMDEETTVLYVLFQKLSHTEKRRLFEMFSDPNFSEDVRESMSLDIYKLKGCEGFCADYVKMYETFYKNLFIL